jgi:hypothetical protein
LQETLQRSERADFCHHLHAKLYLLHRTDPNNPTVGIVGSSNLTLAGLSKQGGLNVDVLIMMPATSCSTGSTTVGTTVGAWISLRS